MQTTGFSFRRATSAWLLLFLLSTIGGVLIAYNPSAAWPRFWRIAGGLALYIGFAHTPERIHLGKWELSPLRLALGGLLTLVAMYFLLTNNWASRIGKLPWLDPALRWFSIWQTNLTVYGLNSNVIGGIIAAFIPLQVAALIGNRSSRVWISMVLVGLSALGLLLSESRGAWLALAIVAGGWGLWKLISRRVVNQRQARTAWAVMVATGGLAFVVALTLTPLGDRLLNLRTDRLQVWHNSLDLASDYPVTGLGLGGFEMAYSSYVLLVHVPHTVHAHNLFLDVWLEQGLLGLLALGGLVISAARPNASASRWRPTALASLCVILLHGLMDDVFYGYGGQAIPLLFLPLAILVRPSRTPPAMMRGAQPMQLRPTLVLGGMAVVLLMIVSLSPGAQAMWEANLGALAQTQAELSLYSNEQWGIQDALRRSPKVDLTPAIAHYQAALAHDPTDATANRRMGQIELSLGQYDMARRHLEAAYAAAPGQRATRQMLGECYAIAGEIGQAVALWRTVDTGQGQLAVRESWYYYLGEQEKTAGIVRAAAALNRY